MTGTQAPLIGSDLSGVAYLAGGPRRAVEAAVVAMVEDGRLQVDGVTGQLSAADPRRRHPVEAAVLDATGPRARRSFDGVAWRVRRDVRLREVAERLQQAGLVTRRGGVDATAERTWTAVGLTREGRRVLRGLRSDPATLGASPALAVALAGPRGWPDAGLRTVVFTPPRPTPQPSSAARVEQPRGHRVYGGHADGGSAGAAGAGWGGGFGDCGGGGGGDGGC